MMIVIQWETNCNTYHFRRIYSFIFSIVFWTELFWFVSDSCIRVSLYNFYAFFLCDFYLNLMQSACEAFSLVVSNKNIVAIHIPSRCQCEWEKSWKSQQHLLPGFFYIQWLAATSKEIQYRIRIAATTFSQFLEHDEIHSLHCTQKAKSIRLAF